MVFCSQKIRRSTSWLSDGVYESRQGFRQWQSSRAQVWCVLSFLSTPQCSVPKSFQRFLHPLLLRDIPWLGLIEESICSRENFLFKFFNALLTWFRGYGGFFALSLVFIWTFLHTMPLFPAYKTDSILEEVLLWLIAIISLFLFCSLLPFCANAMPSLCIFVGTFFSSYLLISSMASARVAGYSSLLAMNASSRLFRTASCVLVLLLFLMMR